MFQLFRKSKKKEKSGLPFSDIDNRPLEVGDLVYSYRYGLGKCRIIMTDNGFAYESLESKEKIHWGKMVDAVSKNQKVKKIV